MTTELKRLYTRLVDDRMLREKKNKEKNEKEIEYLKKWHKNHKDFFCEIKGIRKKIESHDHSWKTEKFLDNLIYMKENNVASKGQSLLSKYNFHLLTRKNKKFMSALEKLILNPTEETHHIFDQTWIGQKASIDKLAHNAVIINRVAAACTLEVSTTVHIPKFNKVFNWLIAEEMIPKYSVNKRQYTKGQQWFMKNIFLMKEFKKQFKDELKNKTTDKVYLSHFVWYLYENIIDRNLIKK